MNNINIVNVMFIPPKLPCGLKKKKKTKITNLTQLGLKSLESQLIIRRVRFLSIWERERERENLVNNIGGLKIRKRKIPKWEVKFEI